MANYTDLSFSNLFCDFTGVVEPAASLYAHAHSYQALLHKLRSYTYHGDRDQLFKLMKQFNSTFELHERALHNLELLREHDTLTITTGQQTSLLGGPLYTVFKTIGLIHMARRLTEQTGKPVIPVFWLADEDHDIQEIAGLQFPGQSGMERMALDFGEPAHATGALTLPPSFDAFFDQATSALPNTEFHEPLRALLQECYSGQTSVRDGFGNLLARLFSHHGLLFCGSFNKKIKRHMVPVFETALSMAPSIQNNLTEHTRKVSDAYHQQAHIQDSLLFWHDPEKGRVRLSYRDGIWYRGQERAGTTQDLLTTLHDYPERFSPNVFLRPIVQDYLLPNVAYMGGPAEIAYYAQMQGLYSLFGLQNPFLASRFSATLIEPAIERLLKEFSFNLHEYGKRAEELEQEYLRQTTDPELDQTFETWKQRSEQLHTEMMQRLSPDNPGLLKHGEAMTREYTRSLDRFRKKMFQEQRKREEIQLARLSRIRDGFYPDNQLQERSVAFIYFMAKYGPDLWDRTLKLLEQHASPLFTHHVFLHVSADSPAPSSAAMALSRSQQT